MARDLTWGEAYNMYKYDKGGFLPRPPAVSEESKIGELVLARLAVIEEKLAAMEDRLNDLETMISAIY